MQRKWLTNAKSRFSTTEGQRIQKDTYQKLLNGDEQTLKELLGLADYKTTIPADEEIGQPEVEITTSKQQKKLPN